MYVWIKQFVHALYYSEALLKGSCFQTLSLLSLLRVFRFSVCWVSGHKAIVDIMWNMSSYCFVMLRLCRLSCWTTTILADWRGIEGRLLAVCWGIVLVIRKIPTVGFYRELHNFLKKWPSSRSATKTAIGKLYIQIDPELCIKSTTSCRPDNIFQFL